MPIQGNLEKDRISGHLIKMWITVKESAWPCEENSCFTDFLGFICKRSGKAILFICLDFKKVLLNSMNKDF